MKTFDLYSLSHNHLKDLCRLKQKKFRSLEQKFIAEGARLCREAISAKAKIQEIIASTEALALPAIDTILHLAEELKIPTYSASPTDFKTLTDTQSPQGVVCIINKNQPPWGHWGSLVLCLDNIKDPGNLGTILRSAEWFGVKTICTSRNSVELYNPKVVRSTMGTIFRISVHEGIELNDFVSEQKANGYRIVASVVQGGVPLKDFQKTKQDILLIGSEVIGLSRAQYPIDLQVTIPTRGRGDSLNAAVAASIILYELTK